MHESSSFDPREFLGKLQRDELESPVLLPGMVKPAEDSGDHLLFAHGSACRDWIRISLDSIESIQLMNVVPCNDHTHPLVLLRLKPAATDEGRMFASLMQAATRARRPVRGPVARPGMDGGPRRSRIVRGPRAADDPGITAEPRWCDSVPDVDIDAHGTWCLDWCWESAHQASYMLCDDLRALTTE